MTDNFNRIYNLYKNDVYRLALSFTKSISDSEDIVQNTFIKYYKQNKLPNDDLQIKKWLIRVTINECKNLVLSSWRKRIKSLDETEEKMLKNSIKNNDLLEVLFSLDKKDRIVVHLYYYEDYSIKEISRLLKITESTTKTRLFRARAKLKKILKEEWNYEE